MEKNVLIAIEIAEAIAIAALAFLLYKEMQETEEPL